MKSLAKHEAFINAMKSGQAKTKAQLVYLALLQEPKTIEFFRTTMKMAHQSCTAALSQLEDAGWVFKLKTVRSLESKKSFTLYAAETDIENAKTRAQEIMKLKKQSWIDRGVKNGWITLDNHNLLEDARNFGTEAEDKFQGD